ncbi:hypothetical protein FRB94_001379 [Tulasnella sp. JGI-2019a]|nr:hypothetical protein FRB93_012550 [Tulasnella sp. JGI-2019a]KAG8987871.1 hypothetical protein FRB94_001379 [Tulasnella sp. JGI-2019a]KAG9021827.1 hypothetical protein FRB95_001387 [Tulasnella sp. JGI-2019a]
MDGNTGFSNTLTLMDSPTNATPQVNHHPIPLISYAPVNHQAAEEIPQEDIKIHYNSPVLIHSHLMDSQVFPLPTAIKDPYEDTFCACPEQHLRGWSEHSWGSPSLLENDRDVEKGLGSSMKGKGVNCY